ncbi:P-loop containing nucleoside triphosphate hydrolase protein [Pholiota molesta]|nr:P-loop containing nucleoside triphosphate hydrolase protein [Pholiota molesta]
MPGENTKKTSKFLKSLTRSEDPVFNGQPFDVVIPVLGPTGVGKSTFINYVLESIGKTQRVIVKHDLRSTTSHLNPVIVEFDHDHGFTNPNSDNKGRLVLVDTPGFDDTTVNDAEILRRISVWLAMSYAAKMRLGGVIYLHDITHRRMCGTTLRNLAVFRKLVGEDALKCVVLGTTMWSTVDSVLGHNREEQLKSEFWNDMIEAGSQVVRVLAKDTPRAIVNSILDRAKIRQSKIEFLTIQKELVKMRKFIPQTDAGQTLKYSIDELIKLQRRKVKHLTDKDLEQGREELGQLLKTANKLKVPLGERIKKFLGF